MYILIFFFYSPIQKDCTWQWHMYRLMFWCPTKSTFQNVSHGLFLLPINGIYSFLFKSLCEKIYPLGSQEIIGLDPSSKNIIHAQISLWPLSRLRIKTIDKKVITRMQNYALFIYYDFKYMTCIPLNFKNIWYYFFIHFQWWNEWIEDPKLNLDEW